MHFFSYLSSIILRQARTIFRFIEREVYSRPAKVIGSLLMAVIIFLAFDSKLIGLLVAPVPILYLFGRASQVYFTLSFFFIASIPFLLIFDRDYSAERLAVYGFVSFTVGILTIIIHHICQSYSEARLLGIETKKWLQLTVNGHLLGITVVLFLLGFYYLNTTMTKRFDEQERRIARLGGDRLIEEDREIEKLQQQLKQVFQLLQQSTRVAPLSASDMVQKEAADRVSASLAVDVSVDIRNGAGIPGAARGLEAHLSSKGFTIVSIGNAEEPYVTTTIQYAVSDEKKARLVAEAMVGTSYVLQLEAVTSVPHDVLIILGKKQAVGEGG